MRYSVYSELPGSSPSSTSNFTLALALLMVMRLMAT